MNSLFFSIIIPVYKVENYIRECVQSIICQTYDCFEIILVDDGSPDNCPEICDELALKYKSITVVHQTNQGGSGARNSGIQKASGRYIIFVDSDDYWDDDKALEQLHAQLAEHPVDLLLLGFKDLDNRTGKIKISRNEYDVEMLQGGMKEHVIAYLIESGKFPGSVWITVTNRDFIRKNVLKFLHGYQSEDIDWLLNVFIHAESFSAVNNPFYIYRKYRNTSITGKVNKKTVTDLAFILAKWKGILSSMSDDFAKKLICYLGYCYLMALICYSRLNLLDKEATQKLLLSLNGLLNQLPIRYKIIAYMIKFLGINKGSTLLNKGYCLLHRQ